ncbi:MAG: pyridoxamine 5'-phosphate oxidase family protein [Chromatiaceae bacterium]|nr:pyridoxamine 5'-phosphate oxidase family protein [Chromatiaceae bacterium]
MAQRYSEICDEHKGFIQEQKIFFVGTATADGRVNVSPKWMDSLRVVDKNRVLWLNLTGSGNETSALLCCSPYGDQFSGGISSPAGSVRFESRSAPSQAGCRSPAWS